MRAKKKFSKRILALILSAVMLAEPAGGSLVAHATESDSTLTVSEELPEGTENIGNQEETGNEDNSDNQGEDDSDNQENEGNNSENQENGEDNSDEQKGEEEGKESETEGVGTDNPDGENGDENQEEQNPEEDAEEDSEEEDSEEENEEDNISEEEEDEELEEDEEDEEDLNGFSPMPSDYKLTSAQREMKVALSDSMSEFDDSAEGEYYVERQVFAFADTREEAEAIAEAYHAELLEYEEGIAVLRLTKGTSVGKALRAASSLDNNLPAVYPDYYRYKSVEETQEDDTLLEITEEEYEVEGDAFDVTVSEEPTLESYEQAVEALGEPNMAYDSQYYQWQHVNVGSVYAWDAGYKGQGVKVAVLDTGVSGNSDVNLVQSFNTSNEASADDGDGHGTHVAGIIAASLNGIGGAGIAPEAQIVNVKVLNNDGRGSDSNILQGINRAITERVDIINLSLGGIGRNPAAQIVVNRAYNNGIAVFAAAGNDGGTNMSFPAAYDNVICVGAVDNNNQRAYFSNYGAWVDLSAPGVDIWSTSNSGGFAIMSGTSQACPVAAGEAAVILSSGVIAGSGAGRVTALENLMKKNTVSAGSGMGKGVTSLTKIFKLSTAIVKPTIPVIESKSAADGQSVTFTIKAQAGTTIYYTDNGKAPSFKNGMPGDGTVCAGANSITLPYTVDQKLTKITISAIAVNESGVSSAVKKLTAELKPFVRKIEISGVSQIAKGKSTQLTAEVTPSYAKNKGITWSIVGNPKDISINAKGNVTTKSSVAPGNYTVKAVANDRKGKTGEVSSTYVIKVTESPDYIKAVKFTKTKDTVSIGAQPVIYDVVDKGGFTPTKNPKANHEEEISAADFVWSSSNKELATVDSKGLVTAIAPGSVKITATANDGSNKKAVFNLTIKQLATSVTVTGDDQVAAGASITLKAAVGPDKASNKKVTWVSSDAAKVSVKNGVVKPKAGVSGTFTITAKAADGSEVSGSKKITVKKGKITGITFDIRNKTIFRTTGKSKADNSATINATIVGSTDCAKNAYTCTSSNPGIATATATGDTGNVKINVTATGKAAGKTVITLMATDGSKKKATCTVTVNNPVSKVHIAPTAGNSSYVAKGKSLQLKATLESEYGIVSNKNVKWELYNATQNGSSLIMGNKVTDPKAPVRISNTGKVTATANANPGYMVVKAIASDGSKAEAKYIIRITEPVKTISLWAMEYGEELSSKYIWTLEQIDSSKEYSFDLIFDSVILPYGGVVVSSSNPKVVSAAVVIDNDGPKLKLSADNTGSAVITIKAMDGGGTQVKYKFKVNKK